MRFKAVADRENNKFFLVEQNNEWRRIEADFNLLDLLVKQASEISDLTLSESREENYKEIIPFLPSAYRDFMLYEQHAIDAARGFVRKYLSHLLPIVTAYEKVFKSPFPKLKPGKRFYEYPIYYLGNHLNFVSEGDSITIPSYTKELDYELELGAIITKPLKNASIEEVNDAIGGFLLLNDFSARDVQIDEMESGFGPMKTKNFGSAISSIVVGKEALINRIDDLDVRVIINGETIIESNTRGKTYSYSVLAPFLVVRELKME